MTNFITKLKQLFCKHAWRHSVTRRFLSSKYVFLGYSSVMRDYNYLCKDKCLKCGKERYRERTHGTKLPEISE